MFVLIVPVRLLIQFLLLPLLAHQMFVIDNSQNLLFEYRVNFEVKFVSHQLHFCSGSVSEIVVLTFLTCAKCDYKISSVFDV